MQTILITGTSSGFGLEMARHFLARNWRVVATLGRPGPELLARAETLGILPRDGNIHDT